MKKILIPIGTLLYGSFHAQLTSTENYVYSKTYLDYNGTNATKTSETVQYFDGLGRPKQIVNVKASPQQKDVVTHIEYDVFGRQVKDFLPVPQSNTGNGAIVPNPLSNAVQPGIYGSEKMYAEKILESSPLDRIQQQIQVGNDWINKPVKFDYQFNSDGEVKRYTATFNYTAFQSGIVLSGTYGANQLYKNTVTDEDGNTTTEFKNANGQLLLVRKMLNATESADTYYVYNDYDQLAFVIPPLASNTPLSQAVLDHLCYQYKYDSRNRLAEKKLPGKGWEYMIYDKQNRLVATKDSQNPWLFTKYDRFGRIIYTGLAELGSRSTAQADLDHLSGTAAPNNEAKSTSSFFHSGMQIYYSNSAYPTNIVKILSVNYYDTYPIGSPSVPTQVMGQNVLMQDSQNSDSSTKSLPVASFIKNIENHDWTKNYTWYDQKGRVIGTYSINHLGGYTKTESELDFAGLIRQSVTRHKRLDTDTEKVITETFEYDHQNRLKVHKHKIGNNPEEYLAQNDYNELSQLQTKKVGGRISGNGLQDVNYIYNIRGWMTQINNPNDLGGDLFGYKIKYNQVEGLQTPDASDTSLQVVPKFNGNIAEVDWKTATQENEPLKRYGYVYDGLNRLSAGFYQNETNPSVREYYEKVTYDLNGNIKNMKRTAQKFGATALLVDNLTYDYENNSLSNRLQKVKDAVTSSLGFPYKASPTDIGYDSNGNITSFQDKNISSIQYNYLNLPKKITQDAQVTDYVYRADGVKVKKLFNGLETDYLDGFQYKFTFALEDETGNTTDDGIKLRIIPTSEGYYDSLLNLYVYNYADHLGNVRISYADADHDGNIRGRDMRITHCYPTGNGNEACYDEFVPGEIVANNTYYPFGMLFDHNTQANNSNAYKYKYNGKELQETGMYDYGARFYMPDIGRWGVVDPLAEKMTRHSPYNYTFSNPIRFIDPDGRDPIDYVNEKGKKIGTDGTSDEGVVMVTNKQDQAAIKSADKNGKGVPLNQLTEFNINMIVPNDVDLNESLNVLDRGDANGGLREESSIVDGNIIFRGETGPLPTVGADGMASAPSELPKVLPSGKPRTNIHLHPIGIFQQGGDAYPFNALTPTVGTDTNVFKQFTTNIIVGRLEIGTNKNITRNSDGTFSDSRPIGAAIYRGGNISNPMKLTKSVITNILNRNAK